MAFPKCASYFANRHKGMQILFVVIVTVTAVLFLQQVVPFVLRWTLNIKPAAPEMRYITKGARNYDNNKNNNNNNNRYSPGENSNSENNKNNNNNDNNNNIEIKSDSYIASAHLQQQDQGIIQPLSQPFSNTNGPATMSSLQKSKQTQDDPNAAIIATIPKSVLRQDSNRLFPAGQPADVNGRPSPQNQKEMMIDNEEKSGPPPQPSNSNTSKQKAAATLLNRSEQTESSDPLPVACQFPDLDPHDPIMMYHIKQYSNIDCSGALPNLVYRDGDTLRINTQKARDLGIVVDYCHYESITMTGYSDFAVRHNFTSKPFQDWITIPLNHEHLIVSCFRQSKKIAESFFAIIREKPAAEKELEQNLKRHIEKNAPRETLSVLLIGIDGTSRQNSIRLMPKMRKYVLEKMNAIEMYKFTKVGDNTFPNALGILSGKSLTDIGRRWNKRMPLDSIDDVMLWHEYRDAGYRTAMLLDSIRLTAFHFEKEGWKHPPWDYYYRPLVIATSKRENFFCMGDEPEVTFHSKYWHQLTSLYNNTKAKPYFAYAFNMRITHDIPHRATMADGLYEQFFHELVQRNVLNNTVVVLFSDHGTRTSPLRGNHIGMLETRMPFLFFMFPPWFHTKYPDLIKTMRTNQHRLTSMFDVHATLKDILNFQGQTGKGTLQQREISLFKEIPRERQCSHAGIPMEFCACTQISRVPVSEDEKKAISNALANHIKMLTRSNNYNNRDNVCTPLEMAEVKSIVKIHGDCRCKECNYYGVVVRMEPGGGVFEATVMDDVRIRVKKVIGVVIRLNSYQPGEAECMKDETFKPFCFCKKKL